MKREIEFTALISNGEWVYGQYYSDLNGHYIRTRNKRKQIIDYKIDKETLCQATDLVDKENSKIFEFDIVENTRSKDGRKYVVVYYRGAYRLIQYENFKNHVVPYTSVFGLDYGNSNSDISKSFRQNAHNNFKIVGNIYEKGE